MKLQNQEEIMKPDTRKEKSMMFIGASIQIKFKCRCMKRINLMQKFNDNPKLKQKVMQFPSSKC